MFVHVKTQAPFQSLDDYSDKPDSSFLDDNEQNTLQLAFTFGLLDEETRERYYTDSLDGALTQFQIQQIKSVQKGLQADGKYNGEIDGKFGPNSTKALNDMILENKEVLEAKEIFENFEINQSSFQRIDPGFQSTVTEKGLGKGT